MRDTPPMDAVRLRAIEAEVVSELRFGGSEDEARADLKAKGVDDATTEAILARARAHARPVPRALKPPPKSTFRVGLFVGGIALILAGIALSLISIPFLKHDGGGMYVLFGPVLAGVACVVRSFTSA
jgi:hypothetical protein